MFMTVNMFQHTSTNKNIFYYIVMRGRYPTNISFIHIRQYKTLQIRKDIKKIIILLFHKKYLI